MKIISDMEEIFQVITSLFKCAKKENDDMIPDKKYVREETIDFIFDLYVFISTLEKKVDSLNVELDNINQYEHGYEFVISEDIIPHSNPTKNCKYIVLTILILATFKHELM